MDAILYVCNIITLQINNHKTMKTKRPKGFELKTVKKLNDGGVSAAWTLTEKTTAEETHIDTFGRSSGKPAHKDLSIIFDRLSTHLAASLGFKDLLSLESFRKLTPTEEKAFSTLKPHFIAMIENRVDQIEANEIELGKSLAGSLHVTIKGSMNIANGKNVPVKSSKILLVGTSFGFEADLCKDIEDLTEEVQAYLFEGKKAQLDMFAESNMEVVKETAKEEKAA